MTTTTYPIQQRHFEAHRPADLRRVVATALIVAIVFLSALAVLSVSGPTSGAPTAPVAPTTGPPTSAQVLAAQG